MCVSFSPSPVNFILKWRASERGIELKRKWGKEKWKKISKRKKEQKYGRFYFRLQLKILNFFYSTFSFERWRHKFLISSKNKSRIYTAMIWLIAVWIIIVGPRDHMRYDLVKTYVVFKLLAAVIVTAAMRMMLQCWLMFFKFKLLVC